MGAAKLHFLHICGPSGPHRLRTPDGGYIFMLWHGYCGPTFYRDRICEREIWNWWEFPAICAAFDWFLNRGERC